MFKCIFCAAVFLLIAYPLYYVVIASVSDPMKVAAGEVILWPKGLTLEGYKMVFEEKDLWIGYRNTIFYTVAGTLINILVTFPAAFAVSRKEFLPRRVIMFLFVFTMFFNGGLIPTYILMRNLNMINSIWVFLIPFSLNVYNFIIVRTFFETSIPEELYDAAKIDGCGDFRCFMQIAMPLSKAIVAVIGLYYAVAHWNDYFTGLLYARDLEFKPLQLVLREILLVAQSTSQTGGTGSGYAILSVISMKYAIIIVSTIPIMILYPFLQKYFEKGVMIGAIKG
ncbi:MAG TPA: carbohydrate ABC transporter permease [Candidatus Choladousia intestinigallinarum]|nr:carbohydrate ABC transporter permease [Candidatus Choladousia intestinigallinarum]